MPVDGSRSMNGLVPPRPRYVTNHKPTVDRSVSLGELDPLGKGEPKALSDAGFREAWVRTFESGADTIAKYRHETYYLYEFETANGACDHQKYVEGLGRADQVTADGVPDAAEISEGPSTGKEATTMLMATKGRFRVMVKAEARDADLARFGAMDMLERFYDRVT